MLRSTDGKNLKLLIKASKKKLMNSEYNQLQISVVQCSLHQSKSYCNHWCECFLKMSEALFLVTSLYSSIETEQMHLLFQNANCWNLHHSFLPGILFPLKLWMIHKWLRKRIMNALDDFLSKLILPCQVYKHYFRCTNIAFY